VGISLLAETKKECNYPVWSLVPKLCLGTRSRQNNNNLDETKDKQFYLEKIFFYDALRRTGSALSSWRAVADVCSTRCVTSFGSRAAAFSAAQMAADHADGD
jgi:hypothetical protein